ncbi:MAG TPA: response regulator [Gemmatimonadaceae bacterium]|nr:response regulator [Gemmatimonadaceae bacterium]
MAILHVDDQPALREIVSQALKAFGYTVVSAEGVHAAKLALDGRDDITGALLDLRLRDGSGVELYEWITVHHPRLAGRVAFLTGSVDANGNQALQATGCRILSKPFEIIDLSRLAAEWEGAASDALPVAERRTGDSANWNPRRSLVAVLRNAGLRPPDVEALREVVCAYVNAARLAGEPYSRLVVDLKEAMREAGLVGHTPTAEERALEETVVAWCAECYQPAERAG